MNRGVPIGTRAHHTALLHASLSAVGALLIGIGALMLIVEAFGPGPTTIWSLEGVLSRPWQRLSQTFAQLGATFVGIGSILLLIASNDLSLLVTLAALVASALLVYLLMTWHLYRAALVARETPGSGVPENRLVRWCLRNPHWADTWSKKKS